MSELTQPRLIYMLSLYIFKDTTLKTLTIKGSSGKYGVILYRV